MPYTPTITIHSRIRRQRLVVALLRPVAMLAPLLGRRASVRLANGIVGLLRVDYRVGRGDWRRLAVDLPRFEA